MLRQFHSRGFAGSMDLMLWPLGRRSLVQWCICQRTCTVWLYGFRMCHHNNNVTSERERRLEKCFSRRNSLWNRFGFIDIRFYPNPEVVAFQRHPWKFPFGFTYVGTRILQIVQESPNNSRPTCVEHCNITEARHLLLTHHFRNKTKR